MEQSHVSYLLTRFAFPIVEYRLAYSLNGDSHSSYDYSAMYSELQSVYEKKKKQKKRKKKKTLDAVNSNRCELSMSKRFHSRTEKENEFVEKRLQPEKFYAADAPFRNQLNRVIPLRSVERKVYIVQERGTGSLVGRERVNERPSEEKMLRREMK